MSRHIAFREPRAHWPLLALAFLVLLGELAFNGYASNAGAEGGGAPPPRTTPPAPADVRAGGPVLRFDASGAVESSRIPARTIALTFDDGPDPVWTPKVLDVLAR